MQSIEHELREKFVYLPKDFIETADGLLFAIVAEGQENGRAIAMLRYHRCGGELRKLGTAEAVAYLQEQHREWLFHSPSRDTLVHGVPIHEITHHYKPSSAIQAEDEPHFARRKCVYDFLHQKLVPHIPHNTLGVTGSLRIGGGNAQSDLDLVVYGHSNFATCQAQLIRMQKEGSIHALSPEQWRIAYERRGCDLSFDEFRWHEERKNNKFIVDGIKIDISCIDAPHPLSLGRGTKTQRIVIEAQVTDATARFGSPAVYEVDHPSILAVISHTPTYAGQAEAGEWIRVAGWHERCDEFERIVVGSSREAIGESIAVLQ